MYKKNGVGGAIWRFLPFRWMMLKTIITLFKIIAKDMSNQPSLQIISVLSELKKMSIFCDTSQNLKPNSNPKFKTKNLYKTRNHISKPPLDCLKLEIEIIPKTRKPKFILANFTYSAKKKN